MRGQISLGRVFNIDIGLHYSWFLIAALLTMSLAAYLYSVNRQWPQTMVMPSLAAVVAALAFFRGTACARAVACGCRSCAHAETPGMVMLVWFG